MLLSPFLGFAAVTHFLGSGFADMYSFPKEGGKTLPHRTAAKIFSKKPFSKKFPSPY